jgi:hypothetical protein
MLKRTKLFSVAFSCLVLISCSNPTPQIDQAPTQNNLGQDLVSMIEKKKGNPEKVIVKVRSLTNFQWDKMYVFTPYTPIAEINRTLGFEWEDAASTGIDRRDDINLIVFVNNGKVVTLIAHSRIHGEFSVGGQKNGFTPESASFEIAEVPQSQKGRLKLLILPSNELAN